MALGWVLLRVVLVLVYAVAPHAMFLQVLTRQGPGFDGIRRSTIRLMRRDQMVRRLCVCMGLVMACWDYTTRHTSPNVVTCLLMAGWKYATRRTYSYSNDEHACTVHHPWLFAANFLSNLNIIWIYIGAVVVLNTMQQQRIRLGYLQELVPFTRRFRSIIYSPESVRQLAETEFARFKALRGTCILPPEDPASVCVHTITSKIVRVARTAQPQIGDLLDEWEVIIVRDDTVNAMCLPGGKIIVYTGLLDECTTDADVAAVLCHEVGHAIAKHGAEGVSRNFWLSIWEAPMRSRGLDVFTKLCQYFFRLPFSRSTELEADYIGLLLLAAAGYDPREAPSFYERLGNLGRDPGWSSYLNTHPSWKKREQVLSQPNVMNKALDLYREVRARQGSEVLNA